jgi:hypothetical protein
MSIATLKKKTQTKYNNMSVGERQFSINGTHRSQGYVGQTSLSRSLPRTLMKGNVAIGHGGCCGKFKKTPIVQSAVISVENPNVVKSSVLGTSGMISTKYAWIKRPQPYTSVKPDNNQNNNSQSDYITYLVDKTLNYTEYALSDTLLVYPPLNSVIKSGTTIVNNREYGNGTYKLSSNNNSYINGFTPLFITNISDSTLYNNRWQSLDYNTNTGSSYNGTTIKSLSSTAVITNVSGVDYNGNWLQIEFPFKIKLNRYSFIPKISGGNNIVYDIVLAGSNDNIIWTLIDKISLIDYSYQTNKNINISPPNRYSSYRLIVLTALDRYPSLAQLQFYSYDKYYCEKEVNTTTISNCCNKKLVKTTSNKPGINYNYAIPSGEYMRRLINCRTKDKHFYVASTNNKQPFAGFN